jgi:hypothetical protein
LDLNRLSRWIDQLADQRNAFFAVAMRQKAEVSDLDKAVGRWTQTTLTLEPANCAYSALVFKG